MIITLQYLEPGLTTDQIPVQAARDRLREAFARVPVDRLLLSWGVSEPLVDAVAEECERANVELYRWHYLLTDSDYVTPHESNAVIGLGGAPVPGFEDMPVFTFMCPNRPVVRGAVLEGLRIALEDTRFHGLFLDRMRWPSPAEGMTGLGCFCPDCQRVAAAQGLDLPALQQDIDALYADPEGYEPFLRALLRPDAEQDDDYPGVTALRTMQQFRAQTINTLLDEAVGVIRGLGRSVGLDCFSASLAPMVGQDLAHLHTFGAWIKVMSYGHTYGPAGLPYEFGGLRDWLIDAHRLGAGHAHSVVIRAAGVQGLTVIHRDSRHMDFRSSALRFEAERAVRAGSSPVLAGIELVDAPGVTWVTPATIRQDIAAFRAAGVAGFALSWDLWHMPLAWLDVVADAITDADS